MPKLFLPYLEVAGTQKSGVEKLLERTVPKDILARHRERLFGTRYPIFRIAIRHPADMQLGDFEPFHRAISHSLQQVQARLQYPQEELEVGIKGGFNIQSPYGGTRYEILLPVMRQRRVRDLVLEVRKELKKTIAYQALRKKYVLTPAQKRKAANEHLSPMPPWELRIKDYEGRPHVVMGHPTHLEPEEREALGKAFVTMIQTALRQHDVYTPPSWKPKALETFRSIRRGREIRVGAAVPLPDGILGGRNRERRDDVLDTLDAFIMASDTMVRLREKYKDQD
ncbi:hypothetical protein KJ765_02015 [Candidatus Micrarchaeota archaeon]|nr:hypothetical protein [Candidatus Micrarchaeota archaeon]